MWVVKYDLHLFSQMNYNIVTDKKNALSLLTMSFTKITPLQKIPVKAAWQYYKAKIIFHHYAMHSQIHSTKHDKNS